MKIFGISLLFLALSLSAQAQDFGSLEDSEQQEQLREAIDEQIENITRQLELEDWQVFYVDSILTHDYGVMQQKIAELGAAKVSTTDAYVIVQDECMENIYNAFNKVFDEKQWNRYLKSGAEKAKKARDKRAEKRNK